jgi:hypothetical protein
MAFSLLYSFVASAGFRFRFQRCHLYFSSKPSVAFADCSHAAQLAVLDVCHSGLSHGCQADIWDLRVKGVASSHPSSIRVLVPTLS